MGMTKQFKPRTGGRGIEWCDVTWNPVGGCQHGCRWQMPDGTIAICYAEEVANNLAMAAYPNGFEDHYWRPHNLKSPKGQKVSQLIFCDSMSDLMGHWVPVNQRQQVFDVMDETLQHTYQMLTKAAPQLLKVERFPENLWVGVSSPPDFMLANESPLPLKAKEKMLQRTLDVLGEVEAKHGNITWLSVEPLSWDMAEIFTQHDHTPDWIVIGAATNGRKKFQPDSAHTAAMLEYCDERGIPVFFKGNLDWSHRREDFPVPPSPYDAAVRRRQEMAIEHGWPINKQLAQHARQVREELEFAPPTTQTPAVGQMSLL